jgi:hypothetical protein
MLSTIISKISEFIYILRTPTVTTEYVTKHNLSYSSTTENAKYDLYWEGNFKTGHEVKVRRSSFEKN